MWNLNVDYEEKSKGMKLNIRFFNQRDMAKITFFSFLAYRLNIANVNFNLFAIKKVDSFYSLVIMMIVHYGDCYIFTTTATSMAVTTNDSHHHCSSVKHKTKPSIFVINFNIYASSRL